MTSELICSVMERPPQRRVAKGHMRAHGALLPEDLAGSLALLKEQDFERLRAAMAERSSSPGKKGKPELGFGRGRTTKANDGRRYGGES